MGCAKSKENDTVVPQNKLQEQTKDNVIMQQKAMQGQKAGKFKDSYTFIKMLGKGAFGEVRSAQHKLSQKIFAVKLIRKVFIEPEEEESILQEIDIMKNLDHPNCIKVIEFYNETEFLYIVMEFCTGGELYERIGQTQKLTERNVCLIMKKILTAINYCHSNKIVHRDLKPENIIFASKDPNSELKIADFGLSAIYGKDKLQERVGTPLYMAPEVINRNYSEKCDIWSIGVILFVLFTGEPPFFAQTKEDLFVKIKNQEVTFNQEVFKSISEDCKDFIRYLLIKNQDKRPTAQQALQHQWFLNNPEIVNAQQAQEEFLQIGNYLKNIGTFRTQSKLQKATWIFFTTFLTADDEYQRLAKAFQKLDANGDGRLSKEEIISGINFFQQTDNPQQEIDNLMKQLDNDQSGKIDYNEFVQAAIDREKMLTANNLQVAFKMLDQNKDGKISIQEYKNMFSGQYISEAVWQQLFAEVDMNGDFELSFEEFQQCLAKLSSKINLQQQNQYNQ